MTPEQVKRVNEFERKTGTVLAMAFLDDRGISRLDGLLVRWQNNEPVEAVIRTDYTFGDPDQRDDMA